jgi:hypothetical protein
MDTEGNKSEMESMKTGSSSRDPIDKQIETAKKYHEALKTKKLEDGEAARGAETSGLEKLDAQEKQEDASKITVDRAYIHNLREEAKEYRKKLESLQSEFDQMQSTLKQYFQVDSLQALAEKLEESRRQKEREEETKLSKVEIAERRAQKLEKMLEEEKIKHESIIKELTASRDKIIIQNALIQAAVANDVANPKQLLRLLQDEFYVDQEKLIPLYKAAEGTMSLEERVKAFLEEPENWNLVRSKIAVGSGAQSTASHATRPLFTKSDLRKMRRENPQEYKQRQSEIMKAYAEGRVRE